jgi:hypothetical protein
MNDADEDEFFGDQEENDDNVHTSSSSYYGRLGDQEVLARENEMKNIGYLEAHEETKEQRLQEGFEAGYRETFDAAMRVGKLLGQATARARLHQEQQEENDAWQVAMARRVREFSIQFEARPKDEPRNMNASQELEDLEVELQQQQLLEI